VPPFLDLPRRRGFAHRASQVPTLKPPSRMATRRDRIIKIRCSEDEWDEIHVSFPKGRVSTIMRLLALGQPPPRYSPALEVRRKELQALARIGNNLNQLARAVNTANVAGSKVDAARVLAKLVEIQDKLELL